jgi:hypothetical protein
MTSQFTLDGQASYPFSLFPPQLDGPVGLLFGETWDDGIAG